MNISNFETAINNLVKRYRKVSVMPSFCEHFDKYWLYLKPYHCSANKIVDVFYIETFDQRGIEVAIYREKMFYIQGREYTQVKELSPEHRQLRELYDTLAERIRKDLWRKEFDEKKNERQMQQKKIDEQKRKKKLELANVNPDKKEEPEAKWPGDHGT